MRPCQLSAELAELAERGIKASRTAVWTFMVREGLSFPPHGPARRRAGPQRHNRRRAQWIAYRDKIEASRLVFIDETWSRTNMVPRCDWGRRGTRLVGKAPHGKWETLTIVAALRHDRLGAPCVFDGACFRSYVKHVLVSTLSPVLSSSWASWSLTRASPYAA